jgi:ribosome-binding factor A
MAGKAPSQRQLRVGELVRHALAEILSRGEVRDPELAGVTVTVPEVRLTPDLKRATAFVMPLGGGKPEQIASALERNRRFLRGAVARRVELKYAPELHFRVDTSFEQGSRIDALLGSPEVRRDLRTRRNEGD